MGTMSMFRFTTETLTLLALTMTLASADMCPYCYQNRELAVGDRVSSLKDGGKQGSVREILTRCAKPPLIIVELDEDPTMLAREPSVPERPGINQLPILKCRLC